MRPNILTQLSDQIKNETCRRFDIDPSSLKMLDGFENIVFEATRRDKPVIVRFTHSSHRSKDQVDGELHWLDYLAGHDLSVCTPLRSTESNLTEHFETSEGAFTAVVFKRAPGGPVKREHWTPEMTYNRGKLLGQMHRLTKDYQPPEPRLKRLEWYEEDDFRNYHRYLLPEDAEIGDRFDEVQDYLKTLPVDRDTYGLIHMDAHTGNIFFEGNQPTLFDFDDCGYDFFISDIAISLFYAVPSDLKDVDRDAFARDFLHTLLEGYRTENRLSNRWRELIPVILKRREIVLFVALHRGFEPAEFDDWCKEYVRTRRERICNRRAYLDLKWSEFTLE